MLRSASVHVDAIEPPTPGRRQRGAGQLVLHPIEYGGFRVVAGHKAYDAAVCAEAERVCCMIRLEDPDDPLELLAEIRGLGGRDPLEEAVAFDDAMRRLGVGQRRLAAMTGIGQSHISKRLKLLRLPPRYRALLQDGRMTVAEALAVAPPG